MLLAQEFHLLVTSMLRIFIKESVNKKLNNTMFDCKKNVVVCVLGLFF